MKQLFPRYTPLAVAGITAAFLAAPGVAWAINYANELARTAQSEVAPQRSDMALVRAERALKAAREACLARVQHAERNRCLAEAEAR